MVFFKRKPKLKKHILRDVSRMPSQHNFCRALKCSTCGKSYIMDVFGGWAVEWDFKLVDDGWKVDPDDLVAAVKHKYSLQTREWFQVDQQECKGDR